MRNSLFALALLAAIGGSNAMAQPVQPAYSSNRTVLSVLLADPQARDVLKKHVPAMFSTDDLVGAGLRGQADAMTLKEIQEATQAFGGDMLSDKVLAAIDADLAQLKPAK